MSWANTVQTVGKWYQANIHNYNQSQYSACSIPNTGKVRHDCSGYVSACMRAAGIISPTQIFRSGDFVGSGSASTVLRKAGFVQLPYSTSAVREYDIIAYNGHVEIFAGVQGGSWRSWSWGSCHDGQNGHVGMPAYTSAKNRYVSIWREGGNNSLGMATAQTDWQSTPWNSGGSTSSGGASNPGTNNYSTYTSDADPAVFASAMSNAFIPTTSSENIDTTTKHTRIYSATEVGIKVDELSMPLNEGTLQADGNVAST